MGKKMLEIIEATGFPFAEPGFKAPSEAIEFSKSINRTRVNDGIASCIGRIIESTEWSDEVLRLYLDNHQFLQFVCADNVVELTIRHGMAKDIGDGSQPQEVMIRLGGKEIHWKRGELIRALEGNALRLIQASQSGFFLYASNVGILAINALKNRLTGRTFLFWEQTD